jgi:hypothetical protein
LYCSRYRAQLLEDVDPANVRILRITIWRADLLEEHEVMSDSPSAFILFAKRQLHFRALAAAGLVQGAAFLHEYVTVRDLDEPA